MNKEYRKILSQEIKNIARLIFARILVSIKNSQKSPLWLISERGDDARDNGYFFFVWIKENHPEINARYIISDKSKDYPKLEKYSDSLVRYDSFDHYKKLWQATYLISTHICGYRPEIKIFSELDRRFNLLKGKARIFLQHGITKADLPALYSENVNLNLFICGARPEYDYVSRNFGYAPGIVKYTGLCRYDNLMKCETKRQILIMPTWRKYIDKNKFTESEYFKAYKALLESRYIQDVAQKNGYQIVFYPHYEIQPLIGHFKSLQLGPNVIIADMSYDVQTLLKESQLLITDYSSVYFDFAFMHKPIIFFQFDQKEFLSRHYAKGWIDESKIGELVTDLSDCEAAVGKVISDGCQADEKYIDYIDSCFEVRDTNNCLRVFDAIKSIKL